MIIKIIIEIIKLMFVPGFTSRRALHKYQKKKIKKHLEYLRIKSEFYKRIGFSNLEELPVINKKIMMDNFEALNTAGINRSEAETLAIESEKSRDFTPQINGITIGLSSGTSGNKSIFLASEKDRIKYVAAIFKKVLFPLKHINTKVALFFRANSNLYESVGSVFIKFKYFDLTKDLSSQIIGLNSFNPHILVAPPTLLNILALKQNEGTLDINPDKIISVAEVLEDDVKMRIENSFSQTIHQLYQCTEGFLASTCKYGNLHLHEEFIYFEKKWLDKDKRRFHPVITDFTRTTQAIVRYELNDILQIGSKCKCGSIYTVIESIEGRSDDIFRFEKDDGKEVIVFPDQIRNAIIIASKYVQNYRVIQINKNRITISLLIEVENNYLKEKEKVLKELKGLIESKGIHNVELIFVKWDQPKLYKKFRRIINMSTRKSEEMKYISSSELEFPIVNKKNFI